MAQNLVKKPLVFTEPMRGVQTPEVTYYGSTMISVLSTPRVHAISLPKSISLTVLPVLWNYLDATAAITVGLNYLLDEKNYRRSQTMAKGLLYILSGLQSFVLTYNPALVAALGITGAPAALAGTAFAFSTLIDFLVATIDFCNAYKMSQFSGWMDEKMGEYDFICAAIQELNAENTLLNGSIDDLELKENIQWATNLNKAKIQEFEARLDELNNSIKIRAKVNKSSLSPTQTSFLQKHGLDDATAISADETAFDTQLNALLNNECNSSRNQLLIKFASFVGIALIAIATFILLTTCPQAIFAVGLSITILVSAVYLHRHKEMIDNKFSAFFKPAHAPAINPGNGNNTGESDSGTNSVVNH